MNGRLRAVVLGTALSLGMLAAPAAWAAEPVVVVDTAALARESTPGRAAASYLENVRVSLQKSLDELQNLYKGKEKTKEAQEAIAEGHAVLERQLALYRQATARELDRLIVEAVKTWRGKNKKTLVVLPAPGTLDYARDADVTKDVLREMNKLRATFPDMPQVTVKKAGK